MKTSLKKTLIIASESPDLYTTKRFINESKKLKYNCQYSNPYQFNFDTQSKNLAGKKGELFYLHRTSGIRYDDFDLLVATHHEDLGFQISNPITSLQLFRKKDEQTLFFKRHKLPYINSFFYRGSLDSKNWEKIKSLSKDERYILKMVRGNQGIGVNLIQGVQSLKSLLETFHALGDQKFLLQPFVEHKKEWRVFVIKNETVAVIERNLSKEDFRGNSKRATGKYVKRIPDELRNILNEILLKTPLDYYGIDLIQAKDEIKILEINPVPGFEQVEKLSSLNIAQKILSNVF